MATEDLPPTDSERIEVLEEEVDQLAYTVRALAATTARLAGAGPSLDDNAENASRRDAAASEELVRWVHWLVIRYELDDIPECWAHHGAIVEELDALRAGWLETIGTGQNGLAAMQWHDLAGRAFERLRASWRTCTDGTHRPAELPHWTKRDLTKVARPDFAGRYEPLPRSEPGPEPG